MAAARRTGDEDLVAAAALNLEAIGDRAWDRELRDWCTDALALVSAPRLALRARLLSRMAETLMYDGVWDDAMSTSTQALELAAQSGDDDALIAAYQARQLAVSGPEHSDERWALSGRMTELGQRLCRPEVEMWGRLWRITTGLLGGVLQAGLARSASSLGASATLLSAYMVDRAIFFLAPPLAVSVVLAAAFLGLRRPAAPRWVGLMAGVVALIAFAGGTAGMVSAAKAFTTFGFGGFLLTIVCVGAASIALGRPRGRALNLQDASATA